MQYPLPLPLSESFTADNFIIASCNREAWQWIETWPHWPTHALLLTGPQGSGKTHLGHIWASRADARIIKATDLPAPNPPYNCLIEDIEQQQDQKLLLHWFNTTREQKHHLLMTSSLPLSQLPFTLPDLTSRLQSIPQDAIRQPDEQALAAAMRKQFADRQLKIEEEVIAYIVARMERSFPAVHALVEKLDREALSGHKNITIPFARNCMENR